MSEGYNAITRRYELNGDGTGGQRGRALLKIPPAGTNQAVYVFRISTDRGTDLTQTVAHDSAFCHGLSFDGVYPTTTEDSAQYDNFLGPACNDPGTPFTTFRLRDNPGNEVLGHGYTGGVGIVYDGNGGKLETGNYNINIATALDNSTSRESRTFIWQVKTDLSTDAVDFALLSNNSSIDLTNVDLDNSIDPDDVGSAFGESWSTGLAGQIHGDVTGTNWRPTTGVMAFPTYFMACNASTSLDMAIHYLGVQYSTLTL